MRLRTLGSWLGPTVGGCIGATWIAVTLLGIFGATEPLLGGRFMNWLIGMIIATPLALGLVVALVLTDLALIGRRQIPTGTHALLLSASAPILVGIVYTLHRPGQYGTAFPFVLAIVLPMAGVALATRLILGRKP